MIRNPFQQPVSRRTTLGSLAAGTAALSVPAAVGAAVLRRRLLAPPLS